MTSNLCPEGIKVVCSFVEFCGVPSRQGGGIDEKCLSPGRVGVDCMVPLWTQGRVWGAFWPIAVESPYNYGEESRRCEYNLPPSLHTLISALLNVIIIKDGWGNKISQLEMKQVAAQRPKVSREQRALELILST